MRTALGRGNLLSDGLHLGESCRVQNALQRSRHGGCDADGRPERESGRMGDSEWALKGEHLNEHAWKESAARQDTVPGRAGCADAPAAAPFDCCSLSCERSKGEDVR